MIQQPHFPFEPWALEETKLDLDILPQTESLFALSNGHLGLRGNLDEGEPVGTPGTYLNSVHDLRPLPYAEGGYGFPQSGQTVCNVTDGKLFRLLVSDEPFDVRYGKLHSHKRRLDFKKGVLEREVVWTSPNGDKIRITSTRLVSLTQRAIAAIEYTVEVLDRPARVVLQSELIANEHQPSMSSDPRVASALENPLEAVEHFFAADTGESLLVHKTRRTHILMAAAMEHIIEGTAHMRHETVAHPDIARTTVSDLLRPGDKLRVVKFLSYGWSAVRSNHSIRSQVKAGLAGARHIGWDGLLEEQRNMLEQFWAQADVELEGSAQMQQAVRFAMFHIMQASARAEQRAIPAKGLTGTGYDGHAFWDSETFVLPVALYTYPKAAMDMLRWRLSILRSAEDNARTLGLDGAAFPWRTIHGEECSGYWPAGTAAFHINADIADACLRVVSATQDESFEVEVAMPILVKTARLWASLGHFDRHGKFHIDGVTGPDEYSAIADDNVYTNLMVRRNLMGAVEVCQKYKELADAFQVTSSEISNWSRAADNMSVPYDEELRVHQQSRNFTDHAAWDFARTPADTYPLLLHYPYFDLYRKQVVKQADLVLAMHLCAHEFTDEQKARNFDYYEKITVRDSSLSATTQAVIAAELGHLDLAFQYLRETSYIDLKDLEHNTRDGLHLAALAGIWNVLVAGFGGMRDDRGVLSFKPRLPPQLDHVRFRLRWRKSNIEVRIWDHEAKYTLLEGEPIEARHDGEVFTIGKEPVTKRVKLPPKLPEPTQPVGREPLAGRDEDEDLAVSEQVRRKPET